MIAVVESDADDLAGRQTGGPRLPPTPTRGAEGSVLLQPGIEFLQTACPRKKRLVIIRAQAGGVNATAIAQKRTRLSLPGSPNRISFIVWISSIPAGV